MLVWDTVVAGSVEEVHARFDANCQRGILATTPSVRTARCRSDITLSSARKPSLQPRTRGEHAMSLSCWLACDASAPHARGTRRSPRAIRLPHRFSPARAGNTSDRSGAGPWCTLQPRHARGTRHVVLSFDVAVRFSPAHGEHYSRSPSWKRGFASAPHARGTHPDVRNVAALVRFSPAPAGNTGPCAPGSGSRPLQPRTRGEHFQWNVLLPFDYASAPHVRGTRCGARGGICRTRFSPARAGNTARTFLSCSLRPLQPRTRGEHMMARIAEWRDDASAPHARGTLFLQAAVTSRIFRVSLAYRHRA